MTAYRRFRAAFDFEARDDSEISMCAGETLLVSRKPTGEWPDPEKFMKGINEATKCEGDFPGGGYVEFVEEFIVEPEPVDAPPPPPRRGPPRPVPRTRLPSNQQMSSGELPDRPPVEEKSHNWIDVSFQIPLPCTACEDIIWGSFSQGYKCTDCLAVCHKHCREHVTTTQICVPTNDSSMSKQIEYTHTAGPYTEWTENNIYSWMRTIRLDEYSSKFHEAGIKRGSDLAHVDDQVLEETMGIADEAHRQILLECLDELCRGSSTVMPSIAVHSDDTDGRNLNRLSGVFALHRSPSIQSVQSLLGSLGKKRGDPYVCGHNFKSQTFSTPHWCDVCGRFLWGLVMQGVKCRECGMKAHRMCMTEGIFSCEDWGVRRRAGTNMPSYGLELSSVFDSQTQKAPTVLLKCIEAVESRGIHCEGIYRVSPVKSIMISLKLALDEDPSQVDILDSRWDHNAFSAALKLYLRELPDPVFTYKLYDHFVSAGRVSNIDSAYNQLLSVVDRLPSPHRSTLNTLLDHLVKVGACESQNKMGVRNLALLFGPSLLRPPPENIQMLIENSEVHCRVLEILMTMSTPPEPERPPPPIRPRPPPAGLAPSVPPRTNRPFSQVGYPVGGVALPFPGRDETDRQTVLSPQEREPPPAPEDSSIYMVNVPAGPPASSVEGRGLPPPPPHSSIAHLPLREQGWYWEDITKEEVATKLRDTDDGAFLVRDSSRTKGEYTLTVRKGGSNKLIRVIFSKGKYGFSEPTMFNSVPELVEFYQREPLTKYNARLDITLCTPVSRFAKVDDDDDEDDMDEDEEEREANTDLLLTKLQDISQIFDQKNDEYLQMEATYEETKKDVEKAKNNVSAKSLWLEMIKDQLRIPNESQHIGLSKNDNKALIANAKLLGKRLQEATKALQAAGRLFAEENMQFRTMDKDINTIRPELMRLQWEKEQYTIKLHSLGMSKEEINQRVKDKAFSESESIYGTLYGTLPDLEEDPWSEPALPVVVEDPTAPPPPPRDGARRSLPGTSYPPPTHNRRYSNPITEEGSAQLSPPPPPVVRNRPTSPGRGPQLPPRPEDPGNRPPPPLPPPEKTKPPVDPPARNNSLSSVGGGAGSEKAHMRKETWYCEIDRKESIELLKGMENGTFLCRPAAKPKLLSQGELHTHSIDVVYNGQKHLKVVQLNGKYGFSVPCTSNSLLDLIVRYSDHSLEQHNPGLTTTLKYPVYAEQFS